MKVVDFIWTKIIKSGINFKIFELPSIVSNNFASINKLLGFNSHMY